MAVPSFNNFLPVIPINVPTFLLLATSFCLVVAAAIDAAANTTTIARNSTLLLSPPPSPYYDSNREKYSPFKPTIAVIVGVLTTLFSVTFLLLLYAKHCKRGGINGYGNSNRVLPPSSSMRKNSGIDRSVIESLPVFRFSSLRGQKDGLECAVCLNPFEPVEVLRLLPKCNHAFHVECVDTWLDAHSTCPLCRYRVDPEDILLVGEAKFLQQNQPSAQPIPPPNQSQAADQVSALPSYHRVSGRHSSAGERGNKFLKIILQKRSANPITSRRSLDSSSSGNANANNDLHNKLRKDGLLLMKEQEDRQSFERRFGHRIVISSTESGLKSGQRWSDVQPSDLLYLRSEMIMSGVNSSSGGNGGGVGAASGSVAVRIEGGESGRNVINTRSMSEITGMSREGRCGSRSKEEEDRRRQRQVEVAGVVSRWLAFWISPRLNYYTNNNNNSRHCNQIQMYAAASSSSTSINQLQLPL